MKTALALFFVVALAGCNAIKIEGNALAEGRALKPDEIAKIEWANGESRKLYDEAIEGAMGSK